MTPPDPNTPPTHSSLEGLQLSAALTQDAAPVEGAELLRRLQFVAGLLARAPAPLAGPGLLFRPEGGAVEARPIGEGLVVGRGAAADLRFANHPELSRRHFEVRCDGGRCVLADLGSHNGTFVEGVAGRVQTRELRDGDIIHAGGAVWVFLQSG
jgi:hypothetical protein